MIITAGGKPRAMRALGFFAAWAVCSLSACRATAPAPSDGPSSTWAFAAPWDPRSDSSLRKNAPRLDAVITGWIQLDSLTGAPSRIYPDDPSRLPDGARRLALLTSWHGQRFHPEMVRRIAADRNAIAHLAAHVGAIVEAGGYQGIVFDLEGQSRADLSLVLRMLAAVGDSARHRGASVVAVTLPAADTTAYPTRAFTSVADFVVVMLYDEHWSTSAPGPIASPAWVRRNLAQRVSDVGANRVVAAFPLYGYLWRANQPAEPLSFDDARHAATEAGVEIARDPVSRSLHAIQAGSWEIWSSDAELLRALRAEAIDLGVTKIALWRLGLEDPAVWSVVGR